MVWYYYRHNDYTSLYLGTLYDTIVVVVLICLSVSIFSKQDRKFSSHSQVTDVKNLLFHNPYLVSSGAIVSLHKSWFRQQISTSELLPKSYIDLAMFPGPQRSKSCENVIYPILTHEQYSSEFWESADFLSVVGLFFNCVVSSNSQKRHT